MKHSHGIQARDSEFLREVKFPFSAEGILQLWLLSMLEEKVFTFFPENDTILFSTSVIDDLFTI